VVDQEASSAHALVRTTALTSDALAPSLTFFNCLLAHPTVSPVISLLPRPPRDGSTSNTCYRQSERLPRCETGRPTSTSRPRDGSMLAPARQWAGGRWL
jgi:hypothetical protein